jgi:arabinan endo-1,5-alpha-L-arabinosidase
MRDVFIMADIPTQTYYLIHYIISSAGKAVNIYTSRDLISWEGPRTIFEAPEDLWPDATICGIWAPELHSYRGKYYLFLTFNTTTLLAEQWRNWKQRVKRASQVLVGDSPFGPFKPFASRPTLPQDMMTLDGTLWVEDGLPWMVYCHEWVQIVNGTVEMIRLTDDLSATIGEPMRLFFGNDASWAKRLDQYGGWVTDGPSLCTSKSGKLLMIWSGFGKGGYTTGLAISDSGRLAGPWRQQPEPIFGDDGGHGCLFRRFDGQLMLVLHQPNRDSERAKLFVLEDTGETIHITSQYP